MSGPAADRPTLVLALGGNAILRKGERGTIEHQTAHAEAAMEPVADLAATGAHIVMTHGNGPVVGNIVERGEAVRDRIAPMPLWIAVADSQGGIGVMLEIALRNRLVARGVDRGVVTIITQTVVDPADPAFGRPTKPIGPYYDAERSAALTTEEGWTFRGEPGCGWRRVVASPAPLRIVETPCIAALAAGGDIVIAAGGGGIPVMESPDGMLSGIDAVVDKDAAGALLAIALRAETFAILMEADAVYLDWGTPSQRRCEVLSAEEASSLLAEGAFVEGSMTPKIRAAVRFVSETGNVAVICRAEDLAAALDGHAGTRIGPA